MPRSKTSSDIELLVTLDRRAVLPLHRQLERELRAAVHNGRLAGGAPMPSSRSLALALGLSRGVVVEAYEQLIAEGYLLSRPSGSTRVAAYAPHADIPPAVDGAASEPAIAFRSGRPDVSQFPRAAWLRSLRRVLNEAPDARLTYQDGRGLPELRAALAGYLNRVRGTVADPDRIIVCGGFTQGMTLISQVLRAAGGRRLALEDPSDTSVPAIARMVGLEVASVPVDEAGVPIDSVVASGAEAIVLTAAHQFPLGGVLPPERRAALVNWARTTSALIIEDDYDAEFRYDREPIGAIQGLAPERVVYIGSASKTLAPGLRLGWMLVPAELVQPLADAKEAADRGSPAIEQLAFADFLVRGEFDHHLRRMRPLYRRRRDALLASIAHHLPDLEPVGASAGLHVLAWLPPGVDEAVVVSEAGRRGVDVDGLTRYRITREDARGALIFGYGNVSERDIDRGTRAIAAALAAARS